MKKLITNSRGYRYFMFSVQSVVQVKETIDEVDSILNEKEIPMCDIRIYTKDTCALQMMERHYKDCAWVTLLCVEDEDTDFTTYVDSMEKFVS